VPSCFRARSARKKRGKRIRIEFGIWNFEFVWNLKFEIWNFRPPAGSLGFGILNFEFPLTAVCGLWSAVSGA